MLWRLTLGDFGPNIQHISIVENIVADALSRLLSTPINKYKSCKRQDQCCANELFTIGRVETNEDIFPLNLLILQREQQKEPRNVNSNLSISTYISDRGSGYSMQ